MWYSGPHLGTTHDLEIWRNYQPEGMIEQEKFLADKAYCSQNERRLIAPIKRSRSISELKVIFRIFDESILRFFYETDLTNSLL